MALPLAFGIATGVTGLLGAVGKYQQESAAANARNQSAINNYRQQLRIRNTKWLQDLTKYNYKVLDYENDLRENSLSASRAYQSEQIKVNEILKAQRFKRQERLIKTQQGVGKVAARGTAGQSALMARQSVLAAAGRQQAMDDASFDSALMNQQFQNERISDQLRIANTNAYRPVRFAPEQGPEPIKPVMQDGPSALSLVSGIAGAALSGIKGGYEMDNIING